MAPYLTLMREDAPQREHALREVFNGLRWMVRTGAPWRLLPHDLPPWPAVYQQTQRWLAAGVLRGDRPRPARAAARGRRARAAEPTRGDPGQPHAAVHARRAGRGAGYDGHKRRKGQQGPRRRSTRWATCWRCSSPRPTSRSGRRSAALAARGAGGDRRDGRGGLRRPGLHRRASRPRRPRRTASAWRWSSCPRPSAASCCCRGAGWSSAASPGWRASAAWRATTNACRETLAGLHFLAFAFLHARPLRSPSWLESA